MNFDRDSLRKAAEHRRNTSAAEKVIVWPCAYCSRLFQTENGFMNHHCKDKEKLSELQSTRGQAAYSYYAEWLKAKQRSVPAQETFLNSRQYNYFIKFVDWAEKTTIPNPIQFIKLMVQENLEPVLWCRANTYKLYLDWYDTLCPPQQQFFETLDVLQNYASEHQVPLNKIYATLGANVIAKLVRKRKLSPWLLATSPTFLSWVQQLPGNEKDLISRAINFEAFAIKFSKYPELSNEFREACEYTNI